MFDGVWHKECFNGGSVYSWDLWKPKAMSKEWDQEGVTESYTNMKICAIPSETGALNVLSQLNPNYCDRTDTQRLLIPHSLLVV